MRAEAEGWLIALDDTTGLRWDDARCRADLSPDEVRRSERFLRAAAAVTYVRARSAVRRVLGQALGEAPGDVRIAAAPGGGPVLPDHPDRCVSWATTSGALLVAVGHGTRIGVDVEVIRPVESPAKVLRIFCPSVHTLGEFREPDTFFSAWTLLEAAVKATGHGLARGARQVQLYRPPGALRCALAGVRDGGATTWAGRTDRFTVPDSSAEVMAAVVTGGTSVATGRRTAGGGTARAGRAVVNPYGSPETGGVAVPFRLHVWHLPDGTGRRAAGARRGGGLVNAPSGRSCTSAAGGPTATGAEGVEMSPRQTPPEQPSASAPRTRHPEAEPSPRTSPARLPSPAGDSRAGAGTDSGLLSPVWAGTPVETVTSDEAWLAAMAEFEAALATAQARLGAVPETTAAAIRAAAADGGLDPVELARLGREAANPVVHFVKRLTGRVAARDPEAAGHVHAGSTSQDVLDSAAMLIATRTLVLVRDDLVHLRAALTDLAREHRSTAAVARTLTQHAVPTTYGARAATWLTLVCDAHDRVDALLSKGLPVSMGGAAGTLAGYHDHLTAAGTPGDHPELRLVSLVADELGLARPALPWHAVRTPIADLAAVLSFVGGALGKFAADVLVLTRTEIAEVAEPATEGRGQSSAMPQKRNPVLSTLVMTAARQLPVYALVLGQSMVAEDERSSGAWHAEWQPLRECLRLAAGASHTAAELAKGLTVSAGRVRANLELTGSSLVAERLSVALVPDLGRQRAKEAVTRAVRATEAGVPAAEALRAALQEAGLVDGRSTRLDSLDELLDPQRYLGAAEPLVDRAVHRAGAAAAPLTPSEGLETTP
ncbi:3-carboxy-cis,cis-muconate cycloisomerase [Streptomyces aurantiacus]|uniref:lyase family protein n=1 Tax=Streptomyces aurantiacus TaxID=47760 RepID=UPI00278EB8F9|nr:lyase family protein [Streptomyces aurantiacus]MDQ0779975.1 3-carboxy-cis,cis-muconate cycloisomerase [Streptomyces aurantiacus]